MSTLRYCTNGCTRKTGDEKIRVQLDPDNPSRICGRCESNLATWLRDIPTNYTLLPTFLEHGTTERNPDSKATKRSEVAAPMRLDVIDLLDERLGRKWHGTHVTEDRRGVIGILHAHVERVRDERNLTATIVGSVTTYAAFLHRHQLWLVEQDWISDLYNEIKALNKAVEEATGKYRRPPVGKCHIEDDDGKPCAGPLFASDYGGVHCARCSETWDSGHLRQLGLAQAEQGTA